MRQFALMTLILFGLASCKSELETSNQGSAPRQSAQQTSNEVTDDEQETSGATSQVPEDFDGPAITEVLEATHGKLTVKMFLRKPTEQESLDTGFVAGLHESGGYRSNRYSRPDLVVDRMEVHIGSSHPRSFNRTYYSDLTNITKMHFEEIDGEAVLTVEMYDQDFTNFTAQYWFNHNFPIRRVIRDDMNPEDYLLVESVFVEP